MPTVEVRKTEEGSRTTPLRVRRSSRDPERVAGMAELILELSAHLASLPTSESEMALNACLETLAFGLQADRVQIYLDRDGEGCFAGWGQWGRPGSGPKACGASVQLAGEVGFAAALHQGVALRFDTPNAFTRRVAADSVFESGAALLLLPIRVPQGLVGFFAVEARSARHGWNQRLIDQAARLSSVPAQFLERCRLEAELEAGREDSARNERLAIVGRVASSVAHDFNNVLTAILGYSDLLEMEMPEHAVGHEELGEIRSAANRACGLVDQILCFGRGTSNGASDFDLAETLRQSEGMLQRVLGSEVELTTRFDACDAWVRADESRVEQILLNLAANARDAMAQAESPGHLQIETRAVELTRDGLDLQAGRDGANLETKLPAGRYVRMRVRDNGSGMDARTRSHLFEAFFTTKPAHRGTGLGLANVAEQMRESGGAILVESEPGRGADFSLYFPIAERPARTD